MELKEAMEMIEKLKAQIAELTVPAAAKAKELSKDEKTLVAEGCKAYGIQDQFVLSANVREGVAVIVTVGGAKVQYSREMAKDKEHPIVALEAVRVDGIVRKKMKSITGGKK